MKSIKQIESSSDFCLLLSLPIELMHYIFTFLQERQYVFLYISRYCYSQACSWITSIQYSWYRDDNGIQYLSSLSNLRQLNLTDCYNITDIGIQYLSSLCNLQQLILSRCYNITDNGIQYIYLLYPIWDNLNYGVALILLIMGYN
jgi:hypothetical protein